MPTDSDLRALRPEAMRQLDGVILASREVAEPRLRNLMGLAIADLIGNEAAVERLVDRAVVDGVDTVALATRDEYMTSELFSPRERAGLSFTEQFVIDVSSIDDSQREAVVSQFPGPEARAFASMLYVTEFVQRLELVAPRLLGGAGYDAGAEQPSGEDPSIAIVEALRDYQDAVMRGTDLDPVTTELVRLRCARTHDCRICKTLRLDSARSAGVDDEMTAKVDFYERSDLDERLKVALRVTDAFITRPDTLSDATVADARSLFTAGQLAELMLDITKWSTQKIHVSLGTDGAERLPTDASGVSYFDFSGDGAVAGFSSTPSMSSSIAASSGG